jgi:hypothetical protein
MLIPNKHSGYSKDGIRLYPIDSGGGGGGGPSNSTTQTSNIPEYARPYVETMLGATQKQLFDTKQTGGTPTYDEMGNQTGMTGQTTEITGMKGYTPFSTDMNKYYAGASPMQEQAYRGAANLGPTQQTADASTLAAQVGLGGLNQQYNPMMAGSQNFGNSAAAQYMSPYAMQALRPQLQEQARASAMQGQEQQAQAVGRGAFGGSRDALLRAERERNLGIQQGNTLATGLNTAYNNATNQFNQDQARAMQAQQANIGQQQFGANLGIQGLQAANQAANTLGTLGQNQFGQEQAAIGLQNQLGTQQQQLEQNKINQQIQNYATQQQWGMQQLSNMNAMLRGLPLQTTSTQSYQAAPSAVSQLAGLGTAAYGVSKMAGGGSVGAPSGLADLAIYNMG